MNIFAEITINYKPLPQLLDSYKVLSSNDTYKILRKHWSDKISYKEEFYILLLNRANVIIGISKISEGGLSGTVVDPKMIFQSALKANAANIILAHNHPSGNLQPSGADISITKRLVQAGLFLELPIIDHIIITETNYYSFADEGLLN